MKLIVAIAALLPLLGGCDQIKERMGMPDPAKQAAEGNAIGSACRHAGRGLEDCYRLNPKAGKAAIFAGWKEMNEYMIKNNMQAVPPEMPVDEHKEKPAMEDKSAEAKTDQTGDKKSEAKTEAKAPDAHGKPTGGH